MPQRFDVLPCFTGARALRLPVSEHESSILHNRLNVCLVQEGLTVWTHTTRPRAGPWRVGRAFRKNGG